MARKPRTPAQRTAAAAAIAVAAVVVAFAERDLKNRPAEQIRGDKRLWRLLSLNAVGAVAYLLAGRRSD